MATVLDSVTFPFRMNITNQNRKEIGEIAAKQLKEFSIAEFENFEGNLYKVERRKRRDLVVFKGTNVSIVAGTKHNAFKKGIGEINHKFGDVGAEYTQTLRHTNMHKDGSFASGDIVIIKAIEIPVVFPGTKPTTVVNGIVTDSTAVTNASNYDAAQMVHNFPKGFEVRYFENNKLKAEGNMDDFPATSGGVLGYAGATPGGIASNALNPGIPLKKVRILVGNVDFRVELEATQDFSMASYGVEYGLPIILHTIEMEDNSA